MSTYKDLFLESLMVKPVVPGTMVVSKKTKERFQVEKVEKGKVTLRDLGSKKMKTVDQKELEMGDYLVSDTKE